MSRYVPSLLRSAGIGRRPARSSSSCPKRGSALPMRKGPVEVRKAQAVARLLLQSPLPSSAERSLRPGSRAAGHVRESLYKDEHIKTQQTVLRVGADDCARCHDHHLLWHDAVSLRSARRASECDFPLEPSESLRGLRPRAADRRGPGDTSRSSGGPLWSTAADGVRVSPRRLLAARPGEGPLALLLL